MNFKVDLDTEHFFNEINKVLKYPRPYSPLKVIIYVILQQHGNKKHVGNNKLLYIQTHDIVT